MTSGSILDWPQGGAEAAPDRYSFLCPDDTTRPLNSSTPCVWVVKPWPVVASGRSKANEVQQLVSSLCHKDHDTWRFSLLNLIQTSYSTLYQTPSVEPIESYLDRAEGFLSANSFSGCHPPRTIRICTTSIIETAKCSWLRESAAVYGIEPDLDCIKADNTSHCMLALNMGAADIVMVPSDVIYAAREKFNLKTLFYETVLDTEKYLTVAVTRPGSDIKSLEDLRGAKACFPKYDGVAWNTMKQHLFAIGAIESCPLDGGMAEFFGPSCVPAFPDELGGGRMKEKCQGDGFDGEFGALHCLSSEVGDVAFVSENSIRKFVADESEGNPGSRLSINDFEILCEGNSKSCHLSWATVGQAMVRGNSSDLWMKDTLDVFLQLDQLFGRNYQSLTTPFTMYGRYNGKPDLLFHDETQNLRDVPFFKNTDQMPRFFNNTFDIDQRCKKSSSTSYRASQLILISAILFYYFV
ncbi:unnamed protein product [Phaedon cochleariae]|uniref:Transferrin-like domain-containing protein n=1 Tax=Phaedon cochleariae TaxID=80249 RepID=A0A9P0DXN4_PHACE|nr:unnamed protein product [Phaedon cochleariae]